MSIRGDKAKQLFLDGYNCCQSVVLAFKDDIGIDEKILIKTASSFGGGFGRLREVCGTFSGISIVVGLLKGDELTKDQQYKLIRDIADQFKKDNVSIICRDLLGETEKLSDSCAEVRTGEYLKKRPCPDLCKYATEIVEKALNI